MLGIIGGMGPAASDLFYEMITEKTHAHSDQENLDLVLISRASMPDRTGAILSKDPARIEDVKGRLLSLGAGNQHTASNAKNSQRNSNDYSGSNSQFL